MASLQDCHLLQEVSSIALKICLMMKPEHVKTKSDPKGFSIGKNIATFFDKKSQESRGMVLYDILIKILTKQHFGSDNKIERLQSIVSILPEETLKLLKDCLKNDSATL